MSANAVLNAEIAALSGNTDKRLFRIAAEDEFDELAQRSAADLGHGAVMLLHARGREAAERWLRQTSDREVQAEPALAL